jgi:hypothetical protein
MKFTPEEIDASMEAFARVPTALPDSDEIRDFDVSSPKDLTDHDLWIASTAPCISMPMREEIIWELMGRAHRNGDKWMRYPFSPEYTGKIFYP